MELRLRYSVATIAAGILLAGLTFPSAAWGRKKHNAKAESQTTATQSAKTSKKHSDKVKKHSHKKAEKEKAAKASTSASKEEHHSRAKETKNKGEMHGSTAAAASSQTASHPVNHRSGKSEATKRMATSRTPPSAGMVWVSKGSKVYHTSGSRYYGNTKDGQWMTPQQAQHNGYRAAKN